MSAFELVSVVIPTYNYAKFLPACIESVLVQQNVRTEIIVVDDGSRDSTQQVLRSFGKKLKIIEQENRGLSAARNTGIEHVSGNLVLFLDSDDLLAKDSIALRLRSMNERPGSQLVVCKNILFSRQTQTGRPIPNGVWPMFRKNLDLHLCHFNVAPPHAFLITRELLEIIGKFDETLSACEDYDFWLRAMVNGQVPSFANGKVYYRKHSASMSSNRHNQFQHDAILHKRVFSSVFGKSEVSIIQDVEKTFAFASGVMRTINNLISLKVHKQLVDELWDLYSLACQQIPETISPDIYEKLAPEGKYYFLLHCKQLQLLASRSELPSRFATGIYFESTSNLIRKSLRSLFQSLHHDVDPGLRWRVAWLCLQLTKRFPITVR